MAAIPESHPVTEPPIQSHIHRSGLTDRQSPTYSVTADCSASPGTTASSTTAAASDSSHGSTQHAAAMAAPFMKRIRVSSKPKAEASSMLSQPLAPRSGQQTGTAPLIADGSEAAATEPSTTGLVLPRSRQAQRTIHAAGTGSQCLGTTDSDVRQMSHTPVHSFSQTFQHDTALTNGNWTGSGSPMPQRAISEQPQRVISERPPTATAHRTHVSASAGEPYLGLSHDSAEASSNNACSHIIDAHRLADAVCQSGESRVAGQCQAQDRPSAQSQQLSAQPQPLSAQSHQLSAQPQPLSAQQLSTTSWLDSSTANKDGSNEQLGSLGRSRGKEHECRASTGRGQQSAMVDRPEGVATMADVHDAWCEVPASPRWWDNVAKTDVIGMKELQRYVRHQC